MKRILKILLKANSLGDYLHSISKLSTLKIDTICPGHGRISDTPDQDLEKAMRNAQALLTGGEDLEIDHSFKDSGEETMQQRKPA